MAKAAPSRPRVSVDGKFFRLGGRKYYVKGVGYGSFAPNAAGQPFGSPEQAEKDFAQIHELGSNLVRVYDVPSKWLLEIAAEHELKLLIDICWNKHLCFLDSPQHRSPKRLREESSTRQARPDRRQGKLRRLRRFENRIGCNKSCSR